MKKKKQQQNFNGFHINLNIKIATDTIYKYARYLFYKVLKEYSPSCKPVQIKYFWNHCVSSIFSLFIAFLMGAGYHKAI